DCSGGASDTSGSSVGPSGGSDAGARAGSDGSAEGGGSESGAPTDDRASRSDAGGKSHCSPTCSGAAPVCDQGICKTCTSTAGCSADAPVCDTSVNGGSGQCKKVEVVAFYTRDPDMYDRAHAAYSRHANAWFPQAAADHRFFTYE